MELNTVNSEKREKYEKYTHVEFIEIYNYLSDKTYPEHVTDKGLKSNYTYLLSIHICLVCQCF